MVYHRLLRPQDRTQFTGNVVEPEYWRRPRRLITDEVQAKVASIPMLQKPRTYYPTHTPSDYVVENLQRRNFPKQPEILPASASDPVIQALRKIQAHNHCTQDIKTRVGDLLKVHSSTGIIQDTPALKNAAISVVKSVKEFSSIGNATVNKVFEKCLSQLEVAMSH